MSQDLKVLEKIELILADFSHGLTRPEQKLIRDLVFGILQSQSSLLSEIARAIDPHEDAKAIHKRLDRNLGNFDLRKAYERAQAKMLSRVDEKFLFIFDPSEIVKPFAEKMEGLSKVRDASEKPRYTYTKIGKKVEIKSLKPGYPLRVAIAMSPRGEIIPVELAIYSYASEFFVSQNDETLQAMENLIHKTNFFRLWFWIGNSTRTRSCGIYAGLDRSSLSGLRSSGSSGFQVNPEKPRAKPTLVKKWQKNTHFYPQTSGSPTARKGEIKTYLFEFTALVPLWKAGTLSLTLRHKKPGRNSFL